MEKVDVDSLRWGAPAFAKAGNLVFIALAAKGDTIEEAAEMFYKAVKARLENEGSSWEHVVQQTTFYVDIDDAVKTRPIRQKYVSDRRFASAGVQVSRLYRYPDQSIPPLQFEAQIIAVIPDKK